MNEKNLQKIREKENNYKKIFENKYNKYEFCGLVSLLRSKRIVIQYCCQNNSHRVNYIETSVLKKLQYKLPCVDCRYGSLSDNADWFKNTFPKANLIKISKYKQKEKSKKRIVIVYKCGNQSHCEMIVNISDIKKSLKKRNHLPCSDCQSLPSENLVKSNFESFFGITFKKVRPDWLKNPLSNCNLELDGFAEIILHDSKYKIAFEYQGEHHEKMIKRSSKQTQDDLIAQFDSIKRNDKLKYDLCQKNNVKLFYIYPKDLKLKDGIKKSILEQSNILGIKLKDNNNG